jgi:hypothetical protein
MKNFKMLVSLYVVNTFSLFNNKKVGENGLKKLFVHELKCHELVKILLT